MQDGEVRAPFRRNFGYSCCPKKIKLLFGPSKWITSQESVKEKLLWTLGPVRSTHACLTLDALQPLHDVWSEASCHGHIVLWTGRTTFLRPTLKFVPMFPIAEDL